MNSYYSYARARPSRQASAAFVWRRILVLFLAQIAVPALCIAQDIDSDGWGVADGDCCDVASAACPHPVFVNPGAFEILGNLVDDDCDVASSDSVTPPDCSTVAKFNSVTGLDLAQAMDICQLTTSSPPLSLRKWGLISALLQKPDGSTPNATELSNFGNKQSAVLANFGVQNPLGGATMAGLSSGTMRDTNKPGYVAPVPGINHGSSSGLPADFLAAHGGTMPQGSTCEGNCPSTASVANDGVNTRLSLRTPTNVAGFHYRYRFFASDFSSFRCTNFNDWHLALLVGQHPSLPTDKNIAIDPDGHFIRTGDFPFQICQAVGCYTCPAGLTPMNNTGFEVSGNGAATGWETAKASVVPRETIDLRLMVFDSGDGLYDSTVLLDAFQWLPEIVFGGPLTAGFE